MTKLEEYKDALARSTEAARRVESCVGILARGNVTPAEQREMAQVHAEHRAASIALTKAEKAFNATLKGRAR